MKNSFYLILASFPLLTGCVTENVPPVDIYTLLPEWENIRVDDRERQIPFILALAPIRGTSAFFGTEIIYTDAQYSQNSYVFSRWNDAPVRLLQTFFLLALEESGLFKAVVPPSSVSEADLILEIMLFDFGHHMKTEGTSEGVVRAGFYLIDNTTKKIVATRDFISRVPTTSQNAKGAVEALNKASINIAHDLVGWLYEFDRF